MRKKVVFVLFAFGVAHGCFGQTLLFKYNTGILWRSNYLQSVHAGTMGRAGSVPSWIALNISSAPQEIYTNPAATNEGRFVLFNAKGSPHLTVPYSQMGWKAFVGWFPSPTGSFFLHGRVFDSNRAAFVTTNTTFYQFNSRAKTWTTNSSLIVPPEGTLTNVSASGQVGTQPSYSLWCDVKNEGGFLVAYVYAY